MSKNIVIAAACIALLFSSSCTNNFRPDSKEDFGIQLTQHLQKIDSTSLEKFSRNYISYNNFVYFIENSGSVTNESFREIIIAGKDKPESRAEYQQEIEEDYNRLRKEDINWDKVFFISFDHYNSLTDELPIFEGVLRLRHYYQLTDPISGTMQIVPEDLSIYTEALFTGKYYELLRIRGVTSAYR